jgi:integrator complex subunit 11
MMTTIRCTPLGAGQDVGRSCILVEFIVAATATTIMLDCGYHLGDPAQPFPDFSQVDLNHLSAVLISHYHIDHVGALPLLTETHKFAGPVFMTKPTQALSALIIEETLLAPKSGFSKQDIRSSLAKCVLIESRETVVVASPLGDLEITAFRAGHVLGAVFFHVKCAGASVLYTGDFNATPDRSLGAAEACPFPGGVPGSLDLLITESTYGATTRGSQRSQEVEFLAKITHTVTRGGKVLIPIFSTGRVSELCSLLDSHWTRSGLSAQVPIVLQTHNAKQIIQLHDEYQAWGGEHVSTANTATTTSVRIGEATHQELYRPGAVVLLTTSAFLVGGPSVEAFKLWASDAKNLVVFPGHCVKGTLGNHLLSLQSQLPQTVKVQNANVQVACGLYSAPFTAHTDAKGIVKLCHQTQPKHVILVHGSTSTMEPLKRRILRELPACDVSMPKNMEPVTIKPPRHAVAASPSSSSSRGVKVSYSLQRPGKTLKWTTAEEWKGL